MRGLLKMPDPLRAADQLDDAIRDSHQLIDGSQESVMVVRRAGSKLEHAGLQGATTRHQFLEIFGAVHCSGA